MQRFLDNGLANVILLLLVARHHGHPLDDGAELLEYLVGRCGGSPSLDPRPENHLERPGRPMLAMQMQIGFCDAVRVDHVVVNSRTCSPVRARTVFLCPANRRVNRYIRYVDTSRHQFSCHALRKS